jgi:hypothetical protein
MESVSVPDILLEAARRRGEQITFTRIMEILAQVRFTR